MRRLMFILVCSGLICLGLVLASPAFGSTMAQTTPDGASWAEQIAADMLAAGEVLPVTSYEVTTKTRTASRELEARVAARVGVAMDQIGCWLYSKKVAGEFAGTVDLWWIKQRLAWCGYDVHGVRYVSGPWWTKICRGRDWGITDAGGGWDWGGWQPGCKKNSTGCKGCSHINRWAKGLFKSFFQTAKPWVEEWGYPGGGWRQEHGGNT
jgi:hypothetical protein